MDGMDLFDRDLGLCLCFFASVQWVAPSVCISTCGLTVAAMRVVGCLVGFQCTRAVSVQPSPRRQTSRQFGGVPGEEVHKYLRKNVAPCATTARFGGRWRELFCISTAVHESGAAPNWWASAGGGGFNFSWKKWPRLEILGARMNLCRTNTTREGCTDTARWWACDAWALRTMQGSRGGAEGGGDA